MLSPESKISAADVLRSDIEPKMDLLRDIQFVFKLYPNLVENGDYSTIRKGLRQEPVIDLRKTCKNLMKYLPADQASPFKRAYEEMIDSLNDLDAVNIIVINMLLN